MKWLLRRRHPYLIAALGILMMAGFAWPAAPPASPVLIPLPARFTTLEGSFVLGPKTVIRVTKPEVNTGEMLAAAIARSTGLKARVRPESKPAMRNGAITLSLDSARVGLGDEGYTLEVTPKGVRITAAKSAGLFYGMQTFRQLLPLGPVQGQTEYQLACVSIEDTPRFGWRGYLLDSSRHFITKATVLDLLDALAMVKINVFHWHLVDDQAWRLAISKYPRLIEPLAMKGGGSTQAMG